jgi:DNA polymerase III epsilon subunit-like protein
MSESGFEILHKGGCPLEDIKGKPLLSDVRKILTKNMTGRLVVGHNLAKDLTSLGIQSSIPLEMRRDTMTYPCLQNEKGHGRALSHLAETKLNRVIQFEKHDAREDALATLELYLKYCHYDEKGMDYDDLVEFYLSQIIDASDSKFDSM